MVTDPDRVFANRQIGVEDPNDLSGRQIQGAASRVMSQADRSSRRKMAYGVWRGRRLRWGVGPHTREVHRPRDREAVMLG